MKVADENIVRFENRLEGCVDLNRSKTAGMVYASQRSREGEIEHDARGLVVAILLCVACWAALGYFLLS
ncbi:hypothetical protein [Novosphingobium mangrovi (ex Huang et al. 2023)]|uniref:Uncharacterized protein n=1 Tax=Novosphingobium mangrovi (ex Huang et al. 2023) TaxID=2976432 RepID=A0ABT2I576_9SPHN|nr:hypothetical protein [Novosphingobium mangrovi (ex Huang et al. 2023)]MCT2399963.1 hypothetical protein [Novosphingobium mangrovi (ex Huang et al. 2023)]